MKFFLTRVKGATKALAERLGVSRRTVERYAGQLTKPQKKLRAVLVEKTYTDYETFMPQAAARLGATDEQLAEFIGPLDGTRGIDIQRRFLLAYFDLLLRGRRAPVLEGPSPRYPEVRFISGVE